MKMTATVKRNCISDLNLLSSDWCKISAILNLVNLCKPSEER